MRIITDMFAWADENVPEWNTISISGYHMREAGSTAVQEVAFTLGNGMAYVEAAIKAGLDVDKFAPRVSFLDRKSTRLNSSHLVISYAVFCLKKKNRTRSILN